jgi:WD40-like Beta Propeller Repeat
MSRRRPRLAFVVAAVSLMAGVVALASGAAPTWKNGKIAFSNGLTLDVVSPNGSGHQTVVECPPAISACGIAEATWSPDGRRLAFVRGHQGGPNGYSTMSLYVIDANGGGMRRLAACGYCGTTVGGLSAGLLTAPGSRSRTQPRPTRRSGSSTRTAARSTVLLAARRRPAPTSIPPGLRTERSSSSPEHLGKAPGSTRCTPTARI